MADRGKLGPGNRNKRRRKKVALIKPKSFLGADLLVDAEASRHALLFSLSCLMYFMVKIYRKETEFIEDIIEELL